jgi:hypothetical protein
MQLGLTDEIVQGHASIIIFFCLRGLKLGIDSNMRHLALRTPNPRSMKLLPRERHCCIPQTSQPVFVNCRILVDGIFGLCMDQDILSDLDNPNQWDNICLHKKDKLQVNKNKKK